MEALEVIIEPTSPPHSAPARRPARKRVRRKVKVPDPAPRGQQTAALVLLVALIVGSVVLAMQVDDTVIRMAAGAVFLLAAFVLAAWAALVLRTGIGPKQLLEVLNVLFAAVATRKRRKRRVASRARMTKPPRLSSPARTVSPPRGRT